MRKVINSMCLLFVFGCCFGQKQALIIKHTGLTDAFIHPLVISTDVINVAFCKKYLKVFNTGVVPLSMVKNIKVERIELHKLDSLLFRIVSTKCDTTKFNYQYGSFDFVSVKNDTLIKKTSINNLVISIEILTEFRDKLYELHLKNFLEIYDNIEMIINEFKKVHITRVVNIDNK